jgi:HEAT repeat protein
MRREDTARSVATEPLLGPMSKFANLHSSSLPMIARLVILLLVSISTSLAADASLSPGVAKPGDIPQLVATLERSNATDFDKARACQQLAIVGDQRAVPALAFLLSEPQLGAFARAALEQIRHAAAGDTLRAALPTLQGTSLVGAVDSLGARGEPASVAALVPLVNDPARGAAPAALIALSRIDSKESVRALREALASSAPELRSAAADGLLRCADRYLARGRSSQAAVTFDAVRDAPVSEPLRMAATRGAILARGSRGIPLLLELVRSPNLAHRNLGAQIARELPGPAVSETLANELRTSSPEIQVSIVQALADRRDLRVADRVAELAGSPELSVRLASLKALGSLGTSTTLPVLIAGVANNDPAIHATAADSLRRVQARKTDASIVSALSHVSSSARARLIAVLGDRQATSASRDLLPQAADPDPEVAKAAFGALAVIAAPRDLASLIEAAQVARHATVREAAERALFSTSLRIADKTKRSEALAAAYAKGGDTPARASLLQVMGLLGDATAYQTVAAAYQDSDPALRDAAFQLLINWPDATPVPLLLETFKSAPDNTRRILALRGVVTLSTLWTDSPERAALPQSPPPSQAVAWLREANAAIRDDTEEKKTVISGLATLNCADGLRLLEPYLADPTVRRDAQLAYLRAAQRLGSAEAKDLARPILRRILSEAADANAKRQAEEVSKVLNPP